jgi:MFS family permease
MCLLMIFGGISCVITVLLPEGSETETLILYLVSKSMICGSFLIIYPFAGELYPTQARGAGIGISSYFGGIGLIIIPFVTYLGKDNLRLPLVIMGVIVIGGGFTGLRLPETLHSKLPQTLEEGEMFGKDFKLKDCMTCVVAQENSRAGSYESLPKETSDTMLEMNQAMPLRSSERVNEKTPLDAPRPRRQTMKKLVRQQSMMDTQKSGDLGSMQLTYWF